jgi:uncharacterized membrane protein YkvA (DUF1232 family)
MDELTEQCLETFPVWLASLGNDARALAASASSSGLGEAASRLVVGSLNYLLKSLDLIPDGIEDLGFIDDAFVLRAACSVAVADLEQAAVDDTLSTVRRLGDEAALIEQFLGEDYSRLLAYARRLGEGAARGRSVDDILTDPSARAAWVADIEAWANSYEGPGFTRDSRSLVKLQSFLKAKLPS